eukprot:3312908-Pleurochrysis_carterae.AAC.1
MSLSTDGKLPKLLWFLHLNFLFPKIDSACGSNPKILPLCQISHLAWQQYMCFAAAQSAAGRSVPRTHYYCPLWRSAHTVGDNEKEQAKLIIDSLHRARGAA